MGTWGGGRGSVLSFEQALIDRCSGQVTIDGHVIGTRSWEGDLADKGYKFAKLGEEQANLLMALDVNTAIPLMSRFYEGGAADRVCVGDLVDQADLHDLLFLVDRGFYSEENLALFTSGGSNYIIPLSKGLSACRQATSELALPGAFVWEQARPRLSRHCRGWADEGELPAPHEAR